GYLFEIINRSFYKINLANKTRRLYIPNNIVPTTLNKAYTKKYYFGRDCMIYNLKKFAIVSKM
ncbi:hypothetical protein QR685DRAFT_440237, partial [Neurospora intermedia]